jgi:hypothetical protein
MTEPPPHSPLDLQHSKPKRVRTRDSPSSCDATQSSDHAENSASSLHGVVLSTGQVDFSGSTSWHPQGSSGNTFGTLGMAQRHTASLRSCVEGARECKLVLRVATSVTRPHHCSVYRKHMEAHVLPDVLQTDFASADHTVSWQTLLAVLTGRPEVDQAFRAPIESDARSLPRLIIRAGIQIAAFIGRLISQCAEHSTG